MKLSRKTTIKLTDVQSNIIGHLCYASGKLWNIANYERKNWTKDSGEDYPDWYVQKKALKKSLWFKSLPAQSAQETLKILDGSWKSFYALKKSGGVKNPKPPRFKQDGFQVTYMQHAIKRIDDKTLRLTIPKQLRKHMSETYGINDNYLSLKNNIFKGIDTIKQIKLNKPENNVVTVIVIYEVPDVKPLPSNGRLLGIDIGVKNLFTCVNSVTGESFIAGRMYFSKARWFDKIIAHYQSINASQQSASGLKYPKISKRVHSLYKKKRNVLNDYLHKVTRAVVEYCVKNNITTVVIGDITNIRKDNNLGDKNNQKLHSLPYYKIYGMLEYKLALEGITLVKQEESYTSQTPPSAPEVTKKYANKKNRIKRGLYKDKDNLYNADSVGAYNILRKFFKKKNTIYQIPVSGIHSPYILKVAV